MPDDKTSRLPPGYRLDLVSDPCIILRGTDGEVVALFSRDVDPEELRRTAAEARKERLAALIHPSAWKVNSANCVCIGFPKFNFRFTEFSEVCAAWPQSIRASAGRHRGVPRASWRRQQGPVRKGECTHHALPACSP
jgi:hypothetical protein